MTCKSIISTFHSFLNAAEKNFCRSEDGSAGGGWGEECRAVRAKSAQPRRLTESLRAETRRKILFSLGEKEIGRAQNEKSKEYFPAGHASEASGGGAVHSFRSKKVRAKDTISPQIETSRFERADARRDGRTARDNSSRRFAANWLGGGNSKLADLSVSYLKTI